MDFIRDEERQKEFIDGLNKRRKDREAADMKKVLSMVEGRRFVWKFLSEAGVFRTSFNQNALNMSFNEGSRNMGLTMLNEILKTNPNSFTQMQREYLSDLKSEQAEIEKQQKLEEEGK
jgi:hypothetical protein